MEKTILKTFIESKGLKCKVCYVPGEKDSILCRWQFFLNYTRNSLKFKLLFFHRICTE